MSIVTLVGLNEDFSRDLLAGGSILMSSIVSNIYIRITFLVLFIAVILLNKIIKNKIIFNSLLVFVFSLWVLSGKMVGVSPYGQINFCWHYFESSRVYLDKDSLLAPEYYASEAERYYASERVLVQETYYEKISYFAYRVFNKQCEVIIYTTPFIDLELEKVLSEHYRKIKK